MFEITKEQNVVIVTATVSPRRFSKEKKIFIHWEDAYREAKNKYPEIEINKTPDNYVIVSNTQQNSGTWRFKINKKEQKKKDKEIDKLYTKIGQLTMERDFLKKFLDS